MPFWQFFKNSWDGHALIARHSKTHHSIWKTLLVLGVDEYLERLEGKIRKFVFFHLKYSKITVPKSFHPTRENPRRDVLWLVQNCCWKGFFSRLAFKKTFCEWLMDNGYSIRTKNHETSKVVGFLGMSVGCPDKIHLCWKKCSRELKAKHYDKRV